MLNRMATESARVIVTVLTTSEELGQMTTHSFKSVT
jgi:hypothetical protein